MDFLKLSWKDFEDFIKDFVEHCSVNNIKFTGVYGIPRGGLVMAVTLSHRLGIPLLGAPCKNCLIVDDIHDSGVSLAHYYHCKYYIATWCYVEPISPLNVPNYYYKKIDGYGKPWVVFPWEEAVQ